MPDAGAALQWIGRRLDDVYGGRLGKIEDVYLDGRTGEPVWLAVRVGRFGDDHVAVPAVDAVAGESGVRVPYGRHAIRSAGQMQPREPLTRERDLALAAHYDLRELREEAVVHAPPASVTCVSALAAGHGVVQ